MTSLSEFWWMSKSSTDKIKFHFPFGHFFFPNRTAAKSFLTKQIKREGRRIEAINYVFCSDTYLLEINRQYLKHDTLTDIITFELSPKDHPLLSDIYISIERVRDNATAFNTSFQKELHRVIFHGALHLCGYKDKSEEQSQQMRGMEEKWLTAYFVPRETESL